jgi:hypothetical protein
VADTAVSEWPIQQAVSGRYSRPVDLAVMGNAYEVD